MRTLAFALAATLLLSTPAQAQEELTIAKIYLGHPPPGPSMTTSAATPEGAITAPPGSIHLRTDTGKFYVKGSGTGNTGWGSRSS